MDKEMIAQKLENLERHNLCRVVAAGFVEAQWKVLCVKCRNRPGAQFERISYSELDCEQCGAKWHLPVTTKAIKCKDKTVTITARYPDLETSRNALS